MADGRPTEATTVKITSKGRPFIMRSDDRRS
jgi:hypothetical protein